MNSAIDERKGGRTQTEFKAVNLILGKAIFVTWEKAKEGFAFSWENLPRIEPRRCDEVAEVQP